MEKIEIKTNHTYVGFRIGKEVFAIQAENVIEVLRKQGLTSVPKTAGYIEGIIHFRGDILSVVSTRDKLNVTGSEKAPKPVVIVIEFNNTQKISKLGITADKVIGVLNIANKDIKPVMEFGNYYNPEFLIGAFKYKDEIITILDIQKVFSEEEVEIITKSKEKV